MAFYRQAVQFSVALSVDSDSQQCNWTPEELSSAARASGCWRLKCVRPSLPSILFLGLPVRELVGQQSREGFIRI